MRDEQKASVGLWRPLVILAEMMVAFGLLWMWVAGWYNLWLASMVGLFLPGDVRVEPAEVSSLVFASPQSGASLAVLPGLVLHVALIVSVAVILATPRVGWTFRLGSAMAGAALVVLSQVALLAYFGHVVRSGLGDHLQKLYAWYWSIFPGVIAILWCYLYWLPKRKAR